MIISRTPFRVSLFGGGTDYPTWFRENGGSVLGMAIDKYCYISVRHLPPFFEHRHRIIYSKIENVKLIEEIQHPAVRAIMQDMGVSSGLEVHHDGDLPARSGLGSSSSFTVGFLNALYALEGRMVPKLKLAEEAIRIEQDVIAENVGSQDQIWAAYGGMNRIDFNTDGTFKVSPLIIGPQRSEELTGSLMLFFTGLQRYASEVAQKKIANLKAQELSLRQMRAMVDEAESLLLNPNGDLDQIGALLHESWRLKRGIADGITTSEIDQIYEAGRAAGALGGKLIGAGGGGFMLFYVKPEHQAAVDEALRGLIKVNFGIERMGSTIVVYEPNGWAAY